MAPQVLAEVGASASAAVARTDALGDHGAGVAHPQLHLLERVPQPGRLQREEGRQHAACAPATSSVATAAAPPTRRTAVRGQAA